MTDDELRTLADRDYYHAMGLLTTTATPIAEAVHGRDVFIVSTGAPVGAFNIGVLKPGGDDPVGAFARVETYFGSRDLPYRVQLRHDQVETLGPMLLDKDYIGLEPIPAMVLREIPAERQHPHGLSIERVVKGGESLDAFRAIVEEGFGMPSGMGASAISDRIVSDRDTALFLGRFEGAPVASSLLVMTNQVAGIYMVATAASHRKHGFGSALTWACALEGMRRGACLASLQASSMGRSVYEKMGFETLSSYYHFASPGSDPSARYVF